MGKHSVLDGILHGVRDIKIERCSRNCTGQ